MVLLLNVLLLETTHLGVDLLRVAILGVAIRTVLTFQIDYCAIKVDLLEYQSTFLPFLS